MSSLSHISLPTPAHADLARRALKTFRGEERVVAVFLGGSVVTGEADEESDLDLTVVEDAALDDIWESLEQGRIKNWMPSDIDPAFPDTLYGRTGRNGTSCHALGGAMVDGISACRRACVPLGHPQQPPPRASGASS